MGQHHNHTTHKNKYQNALFCEEKHDVVSLATSGTGVERDEAPMVADRDVALFYC